MKKKFINRGLILFLAGMLILAGYMGVCFVRYAVIRADLADVAADVVAVWAKYATADTAKNATVEGVKAELMPLCVSDEAADMAARSLMEQIEREGIEFTTASCVYTGQKDNENFSIDGDRATLYCTFIYRVERRYADGVYVNGEETHEGTFYVYFWLETTYTRTDDGWKIEVASPGMSYPQPIEEVQ